MLPPKAAATRSRSPPPHPTSALPSTTTTAEKQRAAASVAAIGRWREAARGRKFFFSRLSRSVSVVARRLGAHANAATSKEMCRAATAAWRPRARGACSARRLRAPAGLHQPDQAMEREVRGGLQCAQLSRQVVRAGARPRVLAAPDRGFQASRPDDVLLSTWRIIETICRGSASDGAMPQRRYGSLPMRTMPTCRPSCWSTFGSGS